MEFVIKSRLYSGYGANLRAVRGTGKTVIIIAESRADAVKIWKALPENYNSLSLGRMIDSIKQVR